MLEPIDYEAESPELPEPYASLVKDADDLWDDFWNRKLNKRYPRYVASEPAQVYAALKHVHDKGLALGEAFIEWGSGFGVATNMAAQMGYDATGIELEAGLIHIANKLQNKHQTGAQFFETSYIPEGFIEYDVAGGSDLVPDDSFEDRAVPPHYSEMDTSLAEIDVFFVYPWPGEQEMMLKLFDSVAGEDAILIAYYGDCDICLYRKV